MKVLSAEQLDAVLQKFLSVAWPVRVDEIDALLATWQWQVEERVGDGGIVIDAGFGFDRPDQGWVYLGNGEVSSVIVAISDGTDAKQLPEALRDAFTAHVAVIAASLGKPTERKAGAQPKAIWMLPSDSRLVLYAAALGNSLEISSPEQGRIRRDAS